MTNTLKNTLKRERQWIIEFAIILSQVLLRKWKIASHHSSNVASSYKQKHQVID